MIGDKEFYESSFKSKENEYKMLSESLFNLVKKGNVNETAFDAITEAIGETLADTLNVSKKLDEFGYKKEDNKSFYDKIEKDNKNKKIAVHKRMEKNVDEEDENKDNNSMDLNFLNTTMDCNKECNREYCDQYAKTNYFLVRFNGALNIEEWKVSGVRYCADGEVEIEIYDFLAEKNGKLYPIISEIKDRMNNSSIPFTFSIDHLMSDGTCLYRERYHGCKIENVFRSGLSYYDEGFAKITFLVKYSSSSYETSC